VKAAGHGSVGFGCDAVGRVWNASRYLRLWIPAWPVGHFLGAGDFGHWERGMRKAVRFAIFSIAVVALGATAVWVGAFRGSGLRPDRLLAAHDRSPISGGLTIRYPFPGTLFPPEIAPPTFQWEDQTGADAWVVAVRFAGDQEKMTWDCRESQWAPPPDAWEAIKQGSVEGEAQFTILGVRLAQAEKPLSAASVAIRTARDAVGAPIFYREVNLPFRDAVADPSRIRWRFGDIASGKQPPIVLDKLPVCGNCHSFSKDAGTMGLDVDYANDKGSYAILPVAREMVLDGSKIITWNDYKDKTRQTTFGLLSQVSPDGKYTVSTVKDESVFVATDNLTYSQLFFPIRGILAVHDRASGQFRALAGADDPEYVQSNPSWSPDGKYLVFARSKAYKLKRAHEHEAPLLSQEDCEEFLKEGKTFLFDLYRIPFHDGQGGKAEPIRGASNNGKSNYFAKFSPDGKWIVFCQSKSFMLLQPDSELYLVPAEGGEARRLSCNLPGMNSWHSWSPNGKWLVFSSKTFTPYTQLFLTHFDEQGETSPPVLLSWFTAADRAANIPEFVDLPPDGIVRIREQFLDDYSYARAARAFLKADDLDQADAVCRKGLAINPKGADVLCSLGVVLARKAELDPTKSGYKAKFAEAETLFTRAIESDPKHYESRVNLGTALCCLDRPQEGLKHLRMAVHDAPDLFKARFALGVTLLNMGQVDEAIEHLSAAVKIEPHETTAQYNLGISFQRSGQLEQAASCYENLLKGSPDHVPALVSLAKLRATAKGAKVRDTAAAIQVAQKACQVTRYQDPESLAILGTAYAEAGRYRDAVHATRQALDAARRMGDPAAAEALLKRLAQYERMAAQAAG
jgi:tetratricopeptide (TPR) repeat protein